MVDSLTRPAAAASAPPPPTSQNQCRKQVFITDASGNPLTFSPGRDRAFNVALGASFADITSIAVRLYESPTDPVEDGENGYILFKKEDGSPSAIGVSFPGAAPDPITIMFSPNGGHPPDQTYSDLLADGSVLMRVGQNTGGTGTFTLLRVEIEVCGTLA